MSVHLDLPRLNLGFFPTPLILLKNLSAYLNGPTIYMKRDDCTGLATGGNKARKLEFLVADAQKNNCDVLVTGGGIQSNHARQTAAAAAKYGLACYLVLNESSYRQDTLFNKNGNVLLDNLFGAQIKIITKDADTTDEMQITYEQLKQEGFSPYLIPIGGSNALGVMGYVVAIDEIYAQCLENNITATHLVCANGTSGTQAGLIIGAYQKNWSISVLGFSVGVKNPTEKIRLKNVLCTTANSLHLNATPFPNYILDDRYIGPGYGQPTFESLSAIKLVAEKEGILLDPVYTSKAMAGLIQYIKDGYFKKSDSIIFIHTGGTAALPAYAAELNSQ